MCELTDLIAEMCPNGVFFKRLGGPNGVCDVAPSSVDKVKSDHERTVKLCNYMDVYQNQYITRDLLDDFMVGSVNENEYQRFVLREGQVLFTKDSETKEDIGQSAYVCSNFDDVVCGYHLAVLNPKDDVHGKYLNYVLQSHNLRSYFSKMANGVSRYGLKLKSIEDARIPIPPLPVQKEIVRILDTFSGVVMELEQNLKAEQAARVRQYEHYRKSIFTNVNSQTDHPFSSHKSSSELSFEKIVTIGEVCRKISSGGTPNSSNESFYGGKIPWLRTQEVNYGDIFDTEIKITEQGFENSSANWIPENSVIVAMYGASAARVAINKIPLTTNQACCNLEVNDKIANYKYVYYWLASQYNELKSLSEGAQPNLNSQKIKKYPIPLPSLDIQNQIVTILDRFEALVKDLKSGLPAEIALRRKQYEYYRDKLLTFPAKQPPL